MPRTCKKGIGIHLWLHGGHTTDLLALLLQLTLGQFATALQIQHWPLRPLLQLTLDRLATAFQIQLWPLRPRSLAATQQHLRYSTVREHASLLE